MHLKFERELNFIGIFKKVFEKTSFVHKSELLGQEINLKHTNNY